jgi:DNA repair photolyase
MRVTREKWHSTAEARPNILRFFEKDAKTLAGDPRRILFCFSNDPYQPLERSERLTRQALEIVTRYGLKNQVLTKGCADLISEDLPLMKKAGTQLGVTLCFSDDVTRKYWEPNASTVDDRIAILKEAYKSGIFTWVSLEPVVDPAQALEVIQKAHKYVKFWKIGKLNHMKTIESTVNWTKFLYEVNQVLTKLGAAYYIKNDLRSFAAKEK